MSSKIRSYLHDLDILEYIRDGTVYLPYRKALSIQAWPCKEHHYHHRRPEYYKTSRISFQVDHGFLNAKIQYLVNIISVSI